MTQFLQRRAHALLSFYLALAITSCKNNVDSTSDTVSWPELTNLDEIAYRADGFARADDLSLVRESLPKLLASAGAVNQASIPPNTADPQQVKTLLTDLTNLVDGLSSPNLDDASLTSLVLGLHPVIEKLIEAAGMPHLHGNEGPNDGFLHPIFNGEGKQIGTAEIKLHDDAGDLEVWLTRGGYEGEAWRLPVNTTLSLDFPDLTKAVTLAVRNRERNEDESGNSTIHDGTTNYFLFPAETGADASWLMGTDFAAKGELRFAESTTGLFVLRPHVH